MTKGSYPYPEDEFDAAPAPDAPVGVHRAPRSWWSRWWPFVAVLVLVPAVTVGLVMWASSWDGELPKLPGTEQEASAPVTTAPATETPAATTPPAAEAPVEEEPAAPEAPAPPPEPDLTVAVEVLNAARITGLAAEAADDLESAGFTSVTAGNGTASGTARTTVFYGTPELAVTAQRVADTLGITTVTESADVAGDGVTVLLLSDFAD